MKEIYDALLNSDHSDIEKESINFVIDGLGPEFNLMVVHILSKLDFVDVLVTLVDTKFLLY